MSKNKNMNASKKQFAIYIIAAFTIAYAFQIIASLLFKNGIQLAYILTLAVSMLAPLLAVVICGGKLRGMGFIPRLKGKIKWIFAALWLPMAFAVIGAALFFLVFPKSFDTTGAYMFSSLTEEQVAMLEEQGVTFPLLVVSQVIQLLTYAPFLNMFFALGEEVGWRGYMYPILKKKFGTNKGRIIGGIIWGVWHWPIMILAGYEYGTDYFGAPFLGPVLFCFCTVVLGIIFDYWYEKTDCIWIPSLGHGAFNGAAGLGMLFFNPTFSKYTVIGPTPIGIVAMTPMIAYMIYICIKERKKSEITT